MNKTKVTKFFKGIQSAMVKHSPEILTGIGVAGMLTSTILAVKATPEALNRIEDERDRKWIEHEDSIGCHIDRDDVEPLTKKDILRVSWKCYIPAATTAVVSVACLIGASSVNARRNAMLATAYKLSETALTEYREKVVETIGEKKEHAIRDKIHKDKIEKNPPTKNEIIITESGNTLCYEDNSGRYFKSDIDKIKKAINEINRKMLNEGYVSLNELYYQLGLSGTKMGDRLGWNTDMGLVEPYFSSQLSDDGDPCLVIDYRVAPKYDYNKIF